MHQTKLICLLRTLSLDDLQPLKEFLESPYFNKNKNVCILFKHLTRFAPKYDQNELKRSVFIATFFPDTLSDINFLDRLNSQLYKLVKEFISMQLSKRDEITMCKKIFFLDYEIDKGTVKNYKKNINLLAAEIEAKATKTALDYNNLMLLSNLEKTIESKLKKQVSFKESIYLLDKSHAYNKLPLLLNELNRSQVLNKSFDIESEKNFLDVILAQNFYDDPHIELTYKQISFLINPEQDTYNYLKSIIRKKVNINFEPNIITNTRTVLINYIIKLVREGSTSLYHIAFDFLESEMVERGKLHYSVFANLIIVALNIKPLEWVDDFLEENKHNIIPVDKAHDAYLINLAKVRFLQNNYTEALELVSQGAINDIYYIISSKMLKIKINYELSLDRNIPDRQLMGILRTIESEISSLKTYLSESNNPQNVSPMRFLSWQHFANLVLRLHNAQSSVNKRQALRAIETRIAEILQKSERISDLDWLNQKISSFRNTLRG
jgi:hypothetical protein